MTDQLKKYCKRFVNLTDDELQFIDKYFEPKTLNRKDFLLREGKVCNFIAFICSGTIRHFHIKDGEEKTCDISFENTFITDFPGFIYQLPSTYYFQAMHNTEILIIKKEDLHTLYAECPKYETIGRMMAELVAQRATEIAKSLSSDKPEERYLKLLKQHPDLLQRVQQKYIANFLGISPESLSRIRKRILTGKKS
jgi:CRP-like cAMP-binding protein